jgi:putative hydrolase of the HAD superfamily
VKRGLTLLLDADDTLWENNIHFERVVDAFCDLLALRGHERSAVRQALLAVERERTRINGYGVRSFRQSLAATCEALLGDGSHAEESRVLDALCWELARMAVTILPGVRETLRELAGRHRLILFTKGDLDDQLGKLQRSGLFTYVHSVDVVREKNVEAYRDALRRHGIRPSSAWMIGNSPRSDILPALAAELGAVFIPHSATWVLEHDELPDPPPPRLLRLNRFEELREHF